HATVGCLARAGRAGHGHPAANRAPGHGAVARDPVSGAQCGGYRPPAGNAAAGAEPSAGAHPMNRLTLLPGWALAPQTMQPLRAALTERLPDTPVSIQPLPAIQLSKIGRAHV